MGTSAARKIYDWDKKMNEMAPARYLPYNQCNANTKRWSEMANVYFLLKYFRGGLQIDIKSVKHNLNLNIS